MSLEKIKEAFKNKVGNFKSRVELSKLLRDGDGFVATVHRDSREERLNVRGYYPEDRLWDEAKKAGNGTIVDILVTRGQEKIGLVSIKNR
ncbi:MAG: hypothetical protein PHO75_00595 [Candidatus Shapirobacteria bacterium]|nr:hypothetical protein [Candidatus Shapirobacteria bacterium]